MDAIPDHPLRSTSSFLSKTEQAVIPMPPASWTSAPHQKMMLSPSSICPVVPGREEAGKAEGAQGMIPCEAEDRRLCQGPSGSELRCWAGPRSSTGGHEAGLCGAVTWSQGEQHPESKKNLGEVLRQWFSG